MTTHSPARTGHLRSANRSLVLAEIRRTPGISRRQLARLTSLTEASLSRIARDLIESGLVQERDQSSRSVQRGRPNVGLFLNPNAHYVLAVCLSTYERKFSLVGLSGERLWECDVPFSREEPIANVLRYVSTSFQSARHSPDARMRRPLGITIALPDAATQSQELLDAANAIVITGELKLPFQVANVTSALHIAETHYAAGSISNSLLLYGGVDLGASLIIDGAVREYRTEANCAGRIAVLSGETQPGHAKLSSLAEAASGRAILAKLGSGMIFDNDSLPTGLRSGLPHAIRQSNSGDPKAVATFHSAGRHLALSYVSVASLLRLQRVVVAGPLGAAQPFMDGFQDVFHETYRNSPQSAPDICRSKISYLQATEFMALSHFVFDKKASLPSGRLITEFEIGSR